TLLWLTKEHNEIMNKVLKQGSLKNYFTTEKYLQNFLKKKYNPADIYLHDLKYDFITAFEYFLRNNPLKKNDPCTNNGTMKHLERLKKMVTWAAKNGWIEKDPFTHYQLKFKRTERGYLSAEELSVIENYDLTNVMLQKVRDLFIFSCYTGLSYIDLVELKPQQIVTSIDRVKWIKSSREKTGLAVNVPLLEPAVMVADKFSKEEDAKFRDSVFPKISNQEMNRSLKVIAEISGIKKYLTFHLARHTFATTVTLMNGVPIESISKMLGHSKIATTMIYARVTQSKIGMDMELLQSRLKDNKEKGKLAAVK
ncbi:MAG TPA: site-specific integrase, partial [Puia sp.]|nr:site-specific integrase [Puia sp.]